MKNKTLNDTDSFEIKPKPPTPIDPNDKNKGYVDHEWQKTLKEQAQSQRESEKLQNLKLKHEEHAGKAEKAWQALREVMQNTSGRRFASSQSSFEDHQQEIIMMVIAWGEALHYTKLAWMGDKKEAAWQQLKNKLNPFHKEKEPELPAYKYNFSEKNGVLGRTIEKLGGPPITDEEKAMFDRAVQGWLKKHGYEYDEKDAEFKNAAGEKLTLAILNSLKGKLLEEYCRKEEGIEIEGDSRLTPT